MFEQKFNSCIKILILFLYAIYAENSPTIVKQTYRFNSLPDDGSYLLNLSKISGDLIVTGHEGSGAFINVEKITFGVTKEDIPNIHKKENIVVTHLEDQYQIHILGDSANKKSNFIQTIIKLNLPKHIHLNFNILGGDISINGIIGNLNLSTLGGDISILDSNGEINSKTNGGTITIQNSMGNSKVHSFGGEINVKKFVGSVSGSTVGGDILLKSISGNINCQSSGGFISLQEIDANTISCRASGGEIIGNNLDANLTLKCFGDKIQIKNINGTSNLYSSGGDILVENFSGALLINSEKGNIIIEDAVGGIEAITSSGDINANLTYDSSVNDYSVYMETHMGNIKTIVPKNYSAEMEIIVYQTTSIKSIDSDIILNLDVENEKVIGKRSIASGIIPFSLKAHHGTITIKDK